MKPDRALLTSPKRAIGRLSWPAFKWKAKKMEVVLNAPGGAHSHWPIYYKAYSGDSATSLGRMWESNQSTQLESSSKILWIWARFHYFICPLVLNFGYLFYRKNICVYSRTLHVIAQYVLRRCTCWLTLRTIGQLITVQEKKLFSCLVCKGTYKNIKSIQ